jgi:hypothetical protein
VDAAANSDNRTRTNLLKELEDKIDGLGHHPLHGIAASTRHRIYLSIESNSQRRIKEQIDVDRTKSELDCPSVGSGEQASYGRSVRDDRSQC